jgi:hypothetical protein
MVLSIDERLARGALFLNAGSFLLCRACRRVSPGDAREVEGIGAPKDANL